MFATNKTVKAAIVFVFLTIGMLSLSLTATASAAYPAAPLSHDDINKVQKSLSDKGLYHGHIDGVMGPRTRQAIGQYQKSENLPVTERLDAETAGKLGVGSESIGGKFKGAGHEVGAGGKEEQLDAETDPIALRIGTDARMNEDSLVVVVRIPIVARQFLVVTS